MNSTGARALIDVLLEQGVDTVFGYPGSAVLDIYDELYKCDKIRHILTCHEQAAAHAAEDTPARRAERELLLQPRDPVPPIS